MWFDEPLKSIMTVHKIGAIEVDAYMVDGDIGVLFAQTFRPWRSTA